jgi:hypothetical protein
MTRDKAELEKTLRELVNDPELREGLKDLGDIIGETLGEVGKKPSRD